MQTSGTSSVDVTSESGTIELLENAVEQWRALCAESTDDQPFYRPEFVIAYVRAFVPEARILLISARAGGKLVAILPLIEDRTNLYGIPVRRLRSPSNYHTLRFDMVRAPGAAGDAAMMGIAKKLRILRGFDLIELENVPENGAAMGLLQAADTAGFPTAKWVSMETPYIPLQAEGEKSWQKYAKHSLVVNVNKCTRKIIRERGTPPVFSRHKGRNEELLKQLYAIEEAGWKGKNGTAISSQADTLSFYNAAAHAAIEQGYFCLDALHCGDALVAASFSMILRKKYYALKWAYNEEFNRYSPGHLLTNALLEQCTKDGITEFDFMGPNMEYKSQWTQLTRPQAFLYVFQSSLKGRLLHWLKFRLAPKIRSLSTPATKE